MEENIMTLDKEILLSPRFTKLPVGAKSLYITLMCKADKYGFVDNVYRLLGEHSYVSGNLEDLCKKDFIILIAEDTVLIADYFVHNKGLFLMDEDRADLYQLVSTVNRRFITMEKANRVRKQSTFVPPTLIEIKAYIKEKRLRVDPEEFYRYYTTPNANGSIWVDRNGKPMSNWKNTCNTWHRNAMSRGGYNGRSVEETPKQSSPRRFQYDV